MLTLLIGFPEVRGASGGKVICGPDVPASEQIEILQAGKRRHQFPKGVKCLVLMRCDPVERAEFIDSSIGEAFESEDRRIADAKKAAEEKAAAATAAQKAIAAAKTKAQQMAQARNQLMGRLHEAKLKIRNLEVTPEKLRAKSFSDTITALQKLVMGDPEKKASGLEQQVSESVAAYENAAQELEALISQKPATTQPINQSTHVSP